MVKHLFDSWEEVARRVKGAKDIRLFLDFDGTLVSYHPDSEKVKLNERTAQALRKLSRRPGVHVAIMSGRRRDTIMKHVKVAGVEFLGLYGWENGENGSLPARTLAKLSELRGRLEHLTEGAPGVSIEDKGISIAVHFRGASPAIQRRVQSSLRKMLAPSRRELHILRSSSVCDVAPTQVRGKGVALRRALRSARKPFLAIFAGDDITDEPAFEALHNGITVLVGPGRKTHARYRLRDEKEVREFLNRLEAALP